MNWLEDKNSVLRISLDDLRKMTRDDFRPEQPMRLDITSPDVTVPLLVVRREYAEQLIILNNGAVDLKRSQGKPIFQRSSWWEDISSHQIYVCDPGTIGPDALALNWMQGTPPLWVNSLIAKTVRIIAQHLDVRNPLDRTYFGSSAGGFAALLQLSADKQARCLVNNAQFDWTKWYAHHVTPVLQAHFAGRTAAEVRKSWPHRANALQYLLRKPEPLNIEYHVNAASSYDIDIQLPIFETFFSANRSLCNSVVVHRYYDDQQGHSPFPRLTTLDLLNTRK